MSQQNFVKILHFFLLRHFAHFAKISLAKYACFDVAEIWYTNWGSKGKYQRLFWGESDKH